MSGHVPDPSEEDIAGTRSTWPRDGRWRSRMVIVLPAIALVGLVIALLVVFADHDKAAARSQHNFVALQGRAAHLLSAVAPIEAPARAEVSVVTHGDAVPVPRSLLGVSTEYFSLPIYERHLSLLEKVLAMLHVSGDGPVVLRIGGDSADQTFWQPGTRRRPHWMFELTPWVLKRTSVLARADDLRLIVDLNLITGSSLKAARLAHAVETAVPRRRILGFEIGNEPDLFNRHNWQVTVAGTGLAPAFLRKELSIRNYLADFAAYGRTLARVTPGVRLAGPALANPARNISWISRLLAGPHAGLGIVTAHRYVFSACAPRRSSGFPTIARILGDHATEVMAGKVRAAVRIAHRAGLPFRVTELNSVSCGGRRGVSNAFATALWAPDALFQLLRAGVDGINIHVRTGAINAAFALSARGLDARPLLYGLILFARTLNGHPRLVQARVRASAAPHLKVWAVRLAGRRLRVLLINKGVHPVLVALRLPNAAPAYVGRMEAPSAASTGGVTLDGQHLGADGRWHGRRMLQRLVRTRGGYEVYVPPTSAALVSVRARR
jgi:hypothetical protein